jgi:hypothetical protein
MNNILNSANNISMNHRVYFLNNDKILLAGVIGALSTIPAELVTRLFLFMGIGKYTAYQLDSLFFTINRPTTTIGLIVCFVVGGLSAILLYFAFKKLGSNNIVIKCAMFSLFMCLSMQILLLITIEGKFIDIRPISDYYIHMFGALIFGISEGLLFKRFLFKKTAQQD